MQGWVSRYTSERICPELSRPRSLGCQKLADHRLLIPIGNGVYDISDIGEAISMKSTTPKTRPTSMAAARETARVPVEPPNPTEPKTRSLDVYA